MGKVTWRGFVTSSATESINYALLCANNTSTPLEVASGIPLELLPENATIAKAEDLFPEDQNNQGLISQPQSQALEKAYWNRPSIRNGR